LTKQLIHRSDNMHQVSLILFFVHTTKPIGNIYSCSTGAQPHFYSNWKKKNTVLKCHIAFHLKKSLTKEQKLLLIMSCIRAWGSKATQYFEKGLAVLLLTSLKRGLQKYRSRFFFSSLIWVYLTHAGVSWSLLRVTQNKDGYNLSPHVQKHKHADHMLRCLV